jgi:hypothetical protein
VSDRQDEHPPEDDVPCVAFDPDLYEVEAQILRDWDEARCSGAVTLPPADPHA